MEKRLALPISPMCDRTLLSTTAEKAKMQIDFGAHLVIDIHRRVAEPRIGAC
jgi:hypothetical protein